MPERPQGLKRQANVTGNAVTSILLATLLLSSPVMAEAAAPGPLPPGKPAGVKKASGSDDEVPWILVSIVATVALGVVVLKPFSSTTPATTQ